MQDNSQVVIHSFAKAIPNRRVTNEDLQQWMDTTDSWITQRTGIKSRHWVEPGTGSSDLAVTAARITLGDRKPDAIIAATLSPDHEFPGIGVLIQHKLGLPNIPAYDIRQQCSGFLYGLEMATAFVRVGLYRSILLVGSEVHSTGLDLSTRGRDIAVLFGDGAGSCLVESQTDAAPAFKVLATELHSDGGGAEDLWCQYPSCKEHRSLVTQERLEAGLLFPTMNGRRVFESAAKRMSEVSASVLRKNNLSPHEIRYLVPHQANLRISMMVADLLGLKPEQCFNTIEHYGNTTAASIPITITDLISTYELKHGDKLIFTSFGSGFTWGAALVEVV